MVRFTYLVLILLFCLNRRANAQLPQTDFKCSTSGYITTCELNEPRVNQARTEYRSVVFHPNDKVYVQAGGCVQTGGHGLTWKLYVNPQGPNSDRLYHGLITLPGVTGPSLVRIQGIVNKPIQLPATIDPANNFLVLGYEDDGYGDNGYYSHDNGTGDQCKDPVLGKPAWVSIQIDRTPGNIYTPTPSSFDLVWTSVDPSYIPFNPEWQYEKANAGQHPDPEKLCGDFPYLDPSNPTNGVSLGTAPCSSQAPSVNSPGTYSLNHLLCEHKAQSGHLDGHLNWMAATFSGTIQWDNHKDWTQGDDDDYNFDFFPDTVTGLTTQNIVNFGSSMIETEFDSDETVDLIDKGWWNTFHKAVDSNDGKPGGPAGALINGHKTIVIGLFGLDSEHGAYSELHPVYGMAIEVADNPGDDQWAFIVRNWGDEGYCSQGSMTIPSTTLSFLIPRPSATGVTANTDELYQSQSFAGLLNGTYETSVAVAGQPGGAVVTFDLGPTEKNTLVSGLVHFAWTTSPYGTHPTGPISSAPIKATLSLPPPRPETDGPGVAALALLNALPPDKQAEVKSKMVKPAQTVPPSTSVKRAASIPIARRTGPLKPQAVANPRKASLDLLRGQVLCGAYGGHIPNVPDSVCASLK